MKRIYMQHIIIHFFLSTHGFHNLSNHIIYESLNLQSNLLYSEIPYTFYPNIAILENYT